MLDQTKKFLGLSGSKSLHYYYEDERQRPLILHLHGEILFLNASPSIVTLEMPVITTNKQQIPTRIMTNSPSFCSSFTLFSTYNIHYISVVDQKNISLNINYDPSKSSSHHWTQQVTKFN